MWVNLPVLPAMEGDCLEGWGDERKSHFQAQQSNGYVQLMIVTSAMLTAVFVSFSFLVNCLFDVGDWSFSWVGDRGNLLRTTAVDIGLGSVFLVNISLYACPLCIMIACIYIIYHSNILYIRSMNEQECNHQSLINLAAARTSNYAAHHEGPNTMAVTTTQ